MSLTSSDRVNTFDPSADVATGEAVVTVTEPAQQYFQRNADKQQQNVIRLSVKTSGCTGFAYVLDFVGAPEEGDHIQPLESPLQLAIANDAVSVVKGTEIDLVQEGINRVVKFNNPNVVAECGCGESFSVS